MADKTVILVVPVSVPENLDLDSVDLASFLDRFIDIGLSDLEDTVNDKDFESSEGEKLVVSQVSWGVAGILKPNLDD